MEIFAPKPAWSLKLLLARPVALRREDVEAAFRQAAAGEAGVDPASISSIDSEGDIAVAAGPCFVSIQPFDHPAWDNFGDVADAAVRQAAAGHKAHIQVHLWQQTGQTNPDRAARILGKLVVSLAGDDCLAIHDDRTAAILVYDAAVRERLLGPDARAALAEGYRTPVVSVPDEDPAMKAAVEEARRRWPEFVRAFQSRREGQVFIVKAPFTEGEHTECMWVKVTDITDQVVFGTLANEPFELKKVKSLDPVEVKVSQVQDWQYGTGRPEIGGFTIKALEDIEKRRGRA